jgi:hypothetical protein
MSIEGEAIQSLCAIVLLRNRCGHLFSLHKNEAKKWLRKSFTLKSARQ